MILNPPCTNQIPANFFGSTLLSTLERHNVGVRGSESHADVRGIYTRKTPVYRLRTSEKLVDFL